MKTTRREIIIGMSTIPFVISACGTDPQTSNLKDDEDDDDQGAEDLTGSISRNHGHTISIPTATFSFSTSIQGESDHDHQVELSLEDLIRLRDEKPLQVISTNDGHTHTVTFFAPGDNTGVVGTNHGHVAKLTEQQLFAGAALTLEIKGTSRHGHLLSLTAAQVQAILDGEQVTATSETGGGHVHEVTFNA